MPVSDIGTVVPSRRCDSEICLYMIDISALLCTPQVKSNKIHELTRTYQTIYG